MSDKPLTMQDICEFEKKTENDVEIEYRNAIRHLLRSSYTRYESNKYMEEELRFRDSIDSLYRYMFGKHPAEEENEELFSESAYEDANAELKANCITDQFYDYISGYRDAADVLVMNAMVRGNKGDQDSSVFPICFLYRQYIELSLKDMYLYYSANTEEEKEKYMKNASHSLWHVWENKVAPMIKPLLVEQFQIDEYNLVERYIKEFQDLDADSFVFRYPISKARKQYHVSSRKINIAGLMDKMRKIEKFFAFNSALLDPVKMHRECDNHRSMAHVFLEDGDFDNAIISYNEALKKKLNWCGEDHSDVVCLYAEMSAVYMMLDSHKQAEEILEKAIDISNRTKNTKFLYILYQHKGMLLSMQKNSDFAIEAFDKSIKHDPGDDQLSLNHIYMQQERSGKHAGMNVHFHIMRKPLRLPRRFWA